MEVSYERWLEAWRTTIQTNLTGAANVAFRAAQVMVQKGGGRIISVSSRGAFRGEPDAPAYGASKAGLNAFSQSMARALASQRVFFFAVAPGWVKTDMAEPHLSGEEGNDIRRQSPLGRIATADEVARLILFLAGEAPATMTGCIVDINGASYLRT
jgi:NAD(P)-dependent dehydrogenase (short-subunit alcohol dehydrogenase family)